MVDIPERQLDDLLATMQKSSGALGKIAEHFDSTPKGRKSASDRLRKDMDKRAWQDNARAMQNATRDVHGFSNALEQFASRATKVGGLIFVFNELIRWGSAATETYRQLSDIGQRFGGSMVEMQRQAAAAGMPLRDFGNLIEKNSGAVARMGGPQGLLAMQKSVRLAAEASGMYGMSVEQLNEYTGQYLDTYRMVGDIQSKNYARSAKAVNELALNVSAVSEITGKSRRAILEDAKAALSNPLFSAALYQNTANGLKGANDEIVNAVHLLAGQFGETGRILAGGLSETVGKFGQAQFTELGKTFIKAGQGQFSALFEDASRRLQAGENAAEVTADLTSKVKRMLDDPMVVENLRMLSLGSGESAQAAQQLLKMRQDLTAMSAAEVKAAKDRAKRATMETTLFNSFKSVWDRLTGTFLEGFLRPFSAMLNDPAAVEKWKKTFEVLAGENGVVTQLGQQFGEFVNRVFTPGNITSMVHGLNTFLSVMTVVGQIIFGFGKIVFGLLNGFNDIMRKIPGMSNDMAGFATGLAAIATFFAAKKLPGLIMKFLTGGRPGIMQVRANIVNVNGGGGGLDDALDGGVGDGGGGKKGRRKGMRLGTRARAAGRAVSRSGIGRAAGAAGNFLKGGAGVSLLKGGALGIVGGMAIDAAINALPDFDGKTALGDAAGYAFAGASLGATLGSIVPGLGNVAGGVIGGVAGGLIGMMKNWGDTKKGFAKVWNGVKDAVGGIWKWITGMEWLKPVVDVMVMMSPVGLAKMGIDFLRNRGQQQNPSAPQPSTPAPTRAPQSNGFFDGIRNFFSPRPRAAPTTPAQPAPVRAAAVPAAVPVAQGGNANDALLREVRALRETVNAQTAIMSRLMQESNRIGRDNGRIMSHTGS